LHQSLQIRNWRLLGIGKDGVGADTAPQEAPPL
jgi:hypothetical protein